MFLLCKRVRLTSGFNKLMMMMSFPSLVTRSSTASTCTGSYWLLDACPVCRSWVWQLALSCY